jgi:hypothetical protein
VAEELKEDRIDAAASGLDRWNGWKDGLVEDYGLQFSFEYNSMMQGFSDEGAGDGPGLPEDWGVTFNASWYFEDSNLLPFIRGGWADGKLTLLDGMVSAGIGKKFCERDLGGVGLSWGSPAVAGQDDQWTAEIFYRKQLRNLAITPSLQLIANPSGNPSEDLMVVAGLRARVAF